MRWRKTVHLMPGMKKREEEGGLYPTIPFEDIPQ
jgi:hypothetical protein